MFERCSWTGWNAVASSKLDSRLISHASKETVNGEAVLRPTLRPPRVGLLVSIPVRHALTGDGLYDLVLAHVKSYVSLLFKRRPLVRSKRYRSQLPWGSRVEGDGVHQIACESPRTAARPMTIQFES